MPDESAGEGIGCEGIGEREAAAMTSNADWRQAHDGTLGPVLQECLLAAIAAPSIHNTQPWRFGLRDNGVDLFVDRTRRLGVIDPYGREALISLGACLF